MYVCLYVCNILTPLPFSPLVFSTSVMPESVQVFTHLNRKFWPSARTFFLQNTIRGAHKRIFEKNPGIYF